MSSANQTHTPGPWTYENTNQHTYAWIVLTEDFDEDERRGTVLCRVSDGLPESDARLIAAAPDMLAALEAIVFQVIQGKVLERDSCIEQARAAIRKARNMSGGTKPIVPDVATLKDWLAYSPKDPGQYNAEMVGRWTVDGANFVCVRCLCRMGARGISSNTICGGTGEPVWADARPPLPKCDVCQWRF